MSISSGSAAPRRVTAIRPSSGWAPLRLGDLWAQRELLLFLVWGDLKLRYKQTALGAAWAVLQPLLTMLVFSIFFGRLAGITSGGVPYPIFAYTALVPWTFFANAFAQGSLSLVRYERIITKVYFPRLIIPLAAVLSGLLDFAIAFVILLGMLLFYGITPNVAIWTLPLFVLLATIVALAVSLWFAALNVQYRDVRYTVPFLTQVWLFLTPIAYPATLVPARWRFVYGLNPMTGVVEGFRWALLNQENAPGVALLASMLMVAALFISGLYYFRRMERSFADVI